MRIQHSEFFKNLNDYYLKKAIILLKFKKYCTFAALSSVFEIYQFVVFK